MDELKARRANLASIFLTALLKQMVPSSNGKEWSRRVVELAFHLADEFILQSEDL